MPNDPLDAIVVVPLRSFTSGKARLAHELGPEARAALSRRMADSVVDATGGRPVVVVSSDEEVRAWATARSLACIDDPGSLDAAARVGLEWAVAQGAARIVVMHADLPNATTIDHVAADGAHPVAVLVPDHRGDGTPVLAIPCTADFRFAYGTGSFERHRAEAARCALDVRVVRDDALGFDIDVPADLARLSSRRP